MEAPGVRGATAQPAERERQGDKGTYAVTQKNKILVSQAREHMRAQAHLLELSGLLSGILKSLRVGMGGTRASLGS